MNDHYVEFMVKRKTPIYQTIFVYFLLFLTIAGVVFFLLTASYIPVILAVAAGLGFYFLRIRFDVEYEYLYVDKEMSIDRIMGKAKRKNIRRINMERVEMVAPVNSWHLGDYKNRPLQVEDYTSGTDQGIVYALISENSRILIEVDDELVKLMKNTMPRKVFTD